MTDQWICDLTWIQSFIVDILNFQTSLEYSGDGGGSVDGFVAILMARSVESFRCQK